MVLCFGHHDLCLKVYSESGFFWKVPLDLVVDNFGLCHLFSS